MQRPQVASRPPRTACSVGALTIATWASPTAGDRARFAGGTAPPFSSTPLGRLPRGSAPCSSRTSRTRLRQSIRGTCPPRGPGSHRVRCWRGEAGLGFRPAPARALRRACPWLWPRSRTSLGLVRSRRRARLPQATALPLPTPWARRRRRDDRGIQAARRAPIAPVADLGRPSFGTLRATFAVCGHRDGARARRRSCTACGDQNARHETTRRLAPRPHHATILGLRSPWAQSRAHVACAAGGCVRAATGGAPVFPESRDPFR